jgi:hypothetical protein
MARRIKAPAESVYSMRVLMSRCALKSLASPAVGPTAPSRGVKREIDIPVRGNNSVPGSPTLSRQQEILAPPACGAQAVGNSSVKI